MVRINKWLHAGHVFFVVLAALLLLPLCASAQNLTGSRPPTAAELTWLNANSVLPYGAYVGNPWKTLVDNTQTIHFPPIIDQGLYHSSVGIATTYYAMTNNVANVLGRNARDTVLFQYSPKWTYNFVNDGQNSNAWIGNAFHLLLDHGAPTLDIWPSFDGSGTDFRVWPTTADIWSNALASRMKQIISVPNLDTDAGQKEAKYLLSLGYVLNVNAYVNQWHTHMDRPGGSILPIFLPPANVTGTDNYLFLGQKIIDYADSFPSSTDIGFENINNTGLQALTIVGYADNIWIDLEIPVDGVYGKLECGAFLVANSWGTGWGNNGLMWVSYDALKAVSPIAGAYIAPTRVPAFYTPSVAQGPTAYLVTPRVNPSQPAYIPSFFTTFSLNSSDRSKLFATLTNTGQWPNALINASWTPFVLSGGNGGSYNFAGTDGAGDGTFVYDFSDLAPPSSIFPQQAPPLPTRWHLLLKNTSALESILTGMSLTDELNDPGNPYASLVTPLAENFGDTGDAYVDYPKIPLTSGTISDSWAFAILSTLQANSFKQSGIVQDLSEQNLINSHFFNLSPHAYSATNFPPVFFPNMATAYFTRWEGANGPGGPVDELDDLYSPTWSTSPDGYPVRAHLHDVLFLPYGKDQNANIALIKKAVDDYGAVFATANFPYATYSAVNATFFGTAAAYPNTATTIVGYSDTFVKTKFKNYAQISANGAFQVVNNFGYSAQSVSQALLWASYYDPMLGKLINTTTDDTPKSSLAVFTNVQPATTYQKAYGYDPYGWVGSLGYSATNTLSYQGEYAVVYPAPSTSPVYSPEFVTATEQIAAVGFYTQALNTSEDTGGYNVSIYLDPDPSGQSPFSFDQSVTPWVQTDPVYTHMFKLARRSTAYPTNIPGFHSFPLVDDNGNPVQITIEPGHRFSVVVKPVNGDGSLRTTTWAPIPVHFRKTGYTDAITPHLGARRSFVSPNGLALVGADNTITGWTDISTSKQHSYQDPYARGTDNYNFTADVCLKAFMLAGDENLVKHWVYSSAGPSGSVSPTPQTAVNAGDSLTLTATPSLDYQVDTWTDAWTDVQGPHEQTQTGGNTYTVVNVQVDHTVSVSFKKQPYTITALAGTHGTITTAPVPPPPFLPNGPFIWVVGDPLPVFTAVPETNYQVDHWYVNGAPKQTGGTTFTLSDIHENKTVQVTFRLPSFTITPSAGANGSIYPGTPVSVYAGQSQTFTATPAAGFAVDCWHADGSPDPLAPGATTYTVEDVQANRSINVTFVRPPQTRPDTYTTAEDTPLHVAASGVLANDTDPNGLPMTAVKIFPPAHAQSFVFNADGSFDYTPVANYFGSDSFSYRAIDAKVQSEATVVTINVTAVNDPPVAGDVSLNTYVGKAVSRTSLPGTDVDGDKLTYQLYTAPRYGRVTITNPSTGAFTYTPTTTSSVTDKFSYRAYDGKGTTGYSLPGTVTITIVKALASAKLTTAPASPRPAGLPVTLRAESVGGLTVTYQFQVGITVSGVLRWQNLSDFTASQYFDWKPGTPGTYKLRVAARDTGGTTVVTVYSPVISYTIVAALSKVTLSISPASPKPVLTRITLTATATGGMSRLYKFVLVDGGNLTELRGFAAANTCVWTPATAGIYHLQVWAVENGALTSTAVKSAVIDYVVTESAVTSPYLRKR